MQPIVSTQNLVKIYGQGVTAVHALRGINLTIQPGEFVAVMGPSGCGKSTLLHLIGGLDRPTSGKVVIEGEDLTQLSDDKVTALRRRKIGFVFQFFNLIPVLNALENAALPMILDGMRPSEAYQRAREWLERVGLGSRLAHRPSELSGGEQQRVAIARALASEPSIILADEPTGNLDSRASEEIAMLLRQISSEWGRTILLVTHDPRIAAYADRIVFLKDGQIVDETVMERRNGEQVDLVVGKMKEIGD
ncbi:ABC transporter ATP-binding protein [uncultured Thermanaerothrix sp.]|uniref:ABC transporter ATP-binding protein n=1 Tax=uncultured Thermanaerothrix sp. TaxID=1195149 RepID=UPI002639BE47|nr:ABC transporter ATP-binding protein [uncultured Thermanaerothrix sp.]